jgi:hypothetical protein
MRRHAFHAGLLAAVLMLLAGSAVAAGDVTFKGTFVVSADIDLVSKISASDQVWCHTRVTSAETSTLFEDANEQATPAGGKNYTCKFTLPFIWDYQSTTFDPGLSAVVDVYVVNPSNSNPTFIDFNLLRHSSHFATGTIVSGTNTFATLSIDL